MRGGTIPNMVASAYHVLLRRDSVCMNCLLQLGYLVA